MVQQERVVHAVGSIDMVPSPLYMQRRDGGNTT